MCYGKDGTPLRKANGDKITRCEKHCLPHESMTQIKFFGNSDLFKVLDAIKSFESLNKIVVLPSLL